MKGACLSLRDELRGLPSLSAAVPEAASRVGALFPRWPAEIQSQPCRGQMLPSIRTVLRLCRWSTMLLENSEQV